MRKYSFIVLIIALISAAGLKAQETGEAIPEFNPDTVFVFKSPRPLVRIAPSERVFDNGIGFHLLMSGNGYGFGMFYSLRVANSLNAFASIYLSGARKSDEFEYYDPETGEIIIPGKKNRLYMIPVMFGVNYYLFRGTLDKAFQPYLSGGLGPTFILANSYQKEFFEAIGYTQFHTRFGGFMGLGADVTSSPKTVLGVDLRYYYIPFGGDGLESIENMPIYNFGGIFLSINFGWKF